MSVGNSHAITSSLGPLGTSAAGTMSVAAGNVGTTPTKISLPAPNPAQFTTGVFRLKISNGHATQRLAWQIVPAGATAPTFNANYAANAGVIVAAGRDDFVNLLSSRELYLVGSAAATDYCVSWELIG